MDKRQILKSIVASMQVRQWDRALRECRQAAVLFPDDPGFHSLITGLAERVAASRPAAEGGDKAAPPAGVKGGADSGASSRAFDAAVRRRVDRHSGASESMGAVMQDSRRISDVLHAATTRHMDEDVDALLAAVRACMGQDLLLEAMRLCRKISVQDPENEEMKGLLQEIYRRKGL